MFRVGVVTIPCCVITPLVSGHGSLVSPPSWADRWGYMGVKPKRNCDAGWDNVFYGDQSKVGWSCMWYSSNVTIPGNEDDIIGQQAHQTDHKAHQPWRSP